MNILFCGTYMPLEWARQLKHSSEAGLKFQRNILEELKVNNNIDVLSYIPYKDSKIDELDHVDYINKIKTSYICKKKCRNFISLFLKYNKTLKELLINKDVIIMYNYSYINLFTVFIAKKLKIKIVLILADYDDPSKEKRFFKKLLLKIYQKNIRDFDGVIFLSEYLSKRFSLKNKIIIEGGIDLNRFEDITLPMISDKIKIMYSGSLEIVSGIDIYLKAIEKIDKKNIEFIFTGKGYLEEQVRSLSLRDKRVNFKGMVDEDTYYKLLQEAHILINAKNMNLIENLDNFPSKVLEYLATGRVIISTKFSGKEKFNNNILFADSVEQDFVRKINNALEDYNKFYIDYYNRNKLFSKEFSWKKQVIKIEDFIKQIN